MIYFFTKGNEAVPSSRRRIFYLSQYLKKFGYESKIFVPTHRPWWEISVNRLKESWLHAKILWFVKKNDVLYLHRPIYQLDFIILVLLFRVLLRRKYIFDFDDPIFLHSPVKTYLLTKLASRVVVGGHFLYDYAVKINNKTTIIPMLVETGHGKIKNDFEFKNKYILGWLGDGKVHFENLKLIKPVLENLVQQKVSFTFKLIGAKGYEKVYELFEIPGLDKEIIDWLNPNEVSETILTFDVALTPLIDSLWERGKCPLKTYEYMQHGIPTVVSNIGEAKFFITNGQNGFLAENTLDWVNAILKIFQDRNLANLISQNARATVEKKFSYQSYIDTYLKLFS